MNFRCRVERELGCWGEEVSAEPQKRITGRERREKGMGGERVRKWQKKWERVWRGEADTEEGPWERKFVGERQIEKVRNLIWLRVSATSRSPSRLPLQMEVNVKQSLLLVSGGINSLERDWAVREVNACLSAQLSPCSNTLYFSECSCCILTLYASSPGHFWSGKVGVYTALPVSFKHCFGFGFFCSLLVYCILLHPV